MAFEEGHALVIGVGNYMHKGIRDVPITFEDAKEVSNVLLDPNLCGYLPERVTCLHDATASRDEILRSLDQIKEAAGEEHTVLLFYSGHGDYGTDGLYYLTTHESQVSEDKRIVAGTGISEFELLIKLQAIRAKRLLLIFNACYSGEISPHLGIPKEISPGGVNLPSVTVNALSFGEGRVIISAAREDQKSWIGEGKLCIFTQALVNGFRGQGYVHDNHGYISATNLYDHVYATVKSEVWKLGETQEPVLSVVHGVGPFAVSLYQGSTQLGAFDDSDVREGPGWQTVDPSQSQDAVNEVVKRAVSGSHAGYVQVDGSAPGAIIVAGAKNITIAPKSQEFATGPGVLRRLLAYLRGNATIGLISFLVFVAFPFTWFVLKEVVPNFTPPVPETMTGEFNVAVAEFAVVNPAGVPIDIELGADRANEWFEALKIEFDNPDTISEFPNPGIWPPELTGKILGDDPEARAEFAQIRAEEINAHVIIYGVITLDGDDAIVEPAFYVNAKGFESASEIIGQYAFGKQIRFSVLDEGFDVNSRLINRIKALSQIIVGMAYYAGGNFRQAEEFLRDASEHVEDDEGKDVVYLLIGNTYLLRASERHPDTLHDQAADYYDKALNTNCEDCSRLRPMLGNLIISQIKAVGDQDDVNFPKDIDTGKLAYVISGYNNILSQASSVHGANLDAKANLGLGQAYQFRVMKQWIDCQCPEVFDQAIRFLELVVKDYEYGNETLKELASKAYVSLGWIAGLLNDDKAYLLYENAAVLAADHDKAQYFYWVGLSYERMHEDVLAYKAYERCHSISEEYDDIDNQELCLEAQQNLSTSNLGGQNALDYAPKYIYMFNSERQQ